MFFYLALETSRSVAQICCYNSHLYVANQAGVEFRTLDEFLDYGCRGFERTRKISLFNRTSDLLGTF